MTYYRYVPGWNGLDLRERDVALGLPTLWGLNFISESRQEIVDAVEHYRRRGEVIEVPDAESFVPLERLVIDCYRPISNPAHRIGAEILDGVMLCVNADSFIAVQGFPYLREAARRAGLYKFVPNPNQIIFLPRSIVDAMHAYDWTRHEQQMQGWMRIHDEVDARLERKETFARVREKKTIH